MHRMHEIVIRHFTPSSRLKLYHNLIMCLLRTKGKRIFWRARFGSNFRTCWISRLCVVDRLIISQLVSLNSPVLLWFYACSMPRYDVFSVTGRRALSKYVIKAAERRAGTYYSLYSKHDKSATHSIALKTNLLWWILFSITSKHSKLILEIVSKPLLDAAYYYNILDLYSKTNCVYNMMYNQNNILNHELATKDILELHVLY